MMLFAAAIPTATPLIVAVALGALGVWLLLPKPRHRMIAFGTFTCLAAAVVFIVWLANRFGPVAVDTVERILFWLFAGGATLFAGVFLTQRNPARGAIAFAFVIVSVCGLFLLLAAPFLMAATIIVYAGAIVVTFLFVLMLSQTRLASDENDRSREPMLGSLAGFCFLGLVLFALLTSSPAGSAHEGQYPLPARPMLPTERASLGNVAHLLTDTDGLNDRDALRRAIGPMRDALAGVVGSPDATPDGTNITTRLEVITDPQTAALRQQAERLRESSRRTFDRAENRLLKATVTPDDLGKVRADLRRLADEVRLLAAHGELPARNVANLGYTLYSDYILAVELVGTILLVATIGAVRIAARREDA